MLLGLSGATIGATVDPAVAVGGDVDAGADAGVDLDGVDLGGGVRAGAVLARFADAVHTGQDLDLARAEVRCALGDAGLVDAAAVCANFNMMVRIADGTGTPLDDGTVAVSAELRSDLGLDRFTSRRLEGAD